MGLRASHHGDSDQAAVLSVEALNLAGWPRAKPRVLYVKQVGGPQNYVLSQPAHFRSKLRPLRVVTMMLSCRKNHSQ